jgi:aminoglycoside phosphotransferase (APT) family kinase protein
MNEFARFTDAHAMQALFQERLPGFNHRRYLITDCRVLRTRYKTYTDEQARHKSFLFAHYGLEVTDMETQQRGSQQLYTQAYLPGRSQIKYRQINAPRLTLPPFGEALVHLPDLGLIVWAFPNDPQLAQLAAVTDETQIKPYLPYPFLPAGLAQPADVTGVVIDVIRYKPEVRCTLRYQVQGEGATMTVYGKTYASDKGREVYRQMVSLWERAVADPACFLVAQPYDYSPGLKMVWQEALAGLPLSDKLLPADDEQWFARAASGLAHLHRQPVAVSRRVTAADLLANSQESTLELMAALPAYRQRLEHLLAGLEQNIPTMDEAAGKLIHGDFHLKQLLAHDGRLAIFDFDDLAWGDPLQDIAFFLVDLHCRDFDRATVERLALAFCQAYQSATGAALPAGRLQWHLQLQFLAKAHWYYKKKQLSPRLMDHIERMLTLAEGEMMFTTGNTP